MCHAEPIFCRPEHKRGVPRRLRTSGRQVGGCRPEPIFFVTPSLFFCRPEHKRGVPRRLRTSGRQVGGCRPEPIFFVTPSLFFVAPRRKPRGPSALAHLGKTKRKARRAYFFVTPSASEGSPLFVFPYHREEISRYARKDKVMRGCLAIARQDKKGALGRTK
jgi:hypothetical protein